MNYKAIQQRLSRKGLSLSIAQIKEYLLGQYPEEVPLDDVPKIVDELLALYAQKIVLAEQSLTEVEKSELIGEVATTLSVNLSLKQIQEISQGIDWVTTSRKARIEEIESAIIAWIDYRVEQDVQQTDKMIGRIESHLSARLQENNKHFAASVQAFSNRVDKAVESFRTTEAEILELFKIPT